MITSWGLTGCRRWIGRLSEQVVAVALQSVRETVAETAREFGLQRAIVREEAKRFGERLDTAVAEADEVQDIPDRDRVTLGLVALAGHERDLILEAFRDQLVGGAAGRPAADRGRQADRGDTDRRAQRLSRRSRGGRCGRGAGTGWPRLLHNAARHLAGRCSARRPTGSS